MGQTSSTNNRIFSITDSTKNLRKGETLRVDFFAKSETNSKISFVTGVRLNNVLICPEETPLREGETRCGRVEMNGEAVGGRWNGTLSFYPQFSGNRVKVDIELDETAWALGVS